MKKKLLSILLAAAMSATLLAGCGSSPDADATSTTQGNEEQTTETGKSNAFMADSAEENGDGTAANTDISGTKTGGTLQVGTAQNPSVVGFTPEITNNSFIQFLRCSYESLLYYDEEGNIVGQLASDWETNAEEATITFTLLESVKFADGTEFNADAVKWNLEQYQAASRSEVNNIDSVEVVDPKTVKINLKEWNSSSLEMVGFFVYYMSPSTFEEKGVEWMRANSCGTGPFTVTSFEQGVNVKYEKNENYHVDGQPYLDGINYIIYADNTTLENSFKAKEVDVITYGNDVDLMKNLSNETGITFDKNANGLGVESVGLITSSADESDPFYDAKVRQAFCYAVDWDTLVSSLSYGMYQRTNQWAAPGAATYNTDLKGYAYDPEKAKALLAEAGYADGFETTFYVPNGAFYQNVATATSASLAEVGITANIEIVDGAKGNDIMANGWEGIYYHFASIGPDLGLYMGRHLDENGAYYAKGIQHPQDCLDLLAQIRVSSDEKEKIDLEWQLQEKIYDEYALFGAPLFVNACVDIRNDYVKGGMFTTVHAATWSPATCWLDN